MKKILSVVGFFALIVALGLLAGTALNGPDGTSEAAAVSDVTSIVPGQAGDGEVEAVLAPEAVAVSGVSWNAIALPLDTGSTTADGIAATIESFCDPACPGAIEKVSRWDPVAQSWGTRTVGGFFPPDFDVHPGFALLIAANDTLNVNSFAWVGDLPPQCLATGCFQYGQNNLPALNASGWNFIMIPLDKSGPTSADALAADIGNVTKVSKWDAGAQSWGTRIVGGFFPPDYLVETGYPYLVLSDGTSSTVWPTSWP